MRLAVRYFILSNVGRTEVRTTERLALIRQLPNLVGESLRIGIRESVLTRSSARDASPQSRAIEQFDAYTERLPLSVAERFVAHGEIASAAKQFKQSRLARRLRALARGSLAAAPTGALDLIVKGRFGVRFATPRDPFHALEIATVAQQAMPGLSGILVYDLGCGSARFIRSPRRTLPRCA
jgi:hypothetical protein